MTLTPRELKSLDETNAILAFDDYYSENRRIKIFPISFPDKEKLPHKTPDIIFKREDGKLVAVEATKVVFSTRHIENKKLWIDAIKKLSKIENQLPGTFSVSFHMEGTTFPKPPKDFLSIGDIVLRDAPLFVSKETREYGAPCKFTLKRYVPRLPKMTYYFGIHEASFAPDSIMKLIESSIIEANEKLGNVKADEKYLVLDDRTESESLNCYNAIEKDKVTKAIKAIPVNTRLNISGYFIIEGPFIYEIPSP